VQFASYCLIAWFLAAAESFKEIEHGRAAFYLTLALPSDKKGFVAGFGVGHQYWF